MAKNKFPLLFVSEINDSFDYTSPRRVINSSTPPGRNRNSHGTFLKNKLDEIWKSFVTDQLQRHAAGLSYTNGLYLEFRSAADFDLITKSLESVSKEVRLLNVKEIKTEQGNVISALVYIPHDQKGFFLKKITDYLEKNNASGSPRNLSLVASIEDIQLAILESFWQSESERLPSETPEWCEVWLRYSSGDGKRELQRFFQDCKELEIENKLEDLKFPERIVVLIKANREDLTNLIKQNDYLAEFRISYSPVSHWLSITNAEQQEWIQNLLSRLEIDNANNTKILILDSGVNNGHRLLESLISDEDLHTYEQEWGVNDNSGHGTLMSGIAAYGDLSNSLMTSGQVIISHALESGKILPPAGSNDQNLYGFITSQVINYAEIQASEANRIICLAVTEEGENTGRPTSWSGALDTISFGEVEGGERLIICAGGNISPSEFNSIEDYPDLNEVTSVHSPGQAWNVLTVGAFTEKTEINDPDLEEYRPMAPSGGLSPFSSTSQLWDRKWPIKPDVLFEGGNLAIDNSDFITECDDLSLLSTFHGTQRRQFETFRMTSAATALASHFAASIQHHYPDAWPETVRGLIVHSANWTDVMKEQFLDLRLGRQGYLNILRICGYGVPNLQEALYCSENHLTLIAQEYLQPFAKEGSRVRTKDMHFYEMPWPEDILLGLEATEVKVKVTLSYFIEPGPGEIGWKDKYRYRSHGLKFDVNTASETRDEFVTRINKASREEGQELTKNDSGRWGIGSAGKVHGSIHSDYIEGTAAELSTCKFIAVYPIIGWWKERKHLDRYDSKCRYSLIVSIQTPEIETDIYTPVATKLKIPIVTL